MINRQRAVTRSDATRLHASIHTGRWPQLSDKQRYFQSLARTADQAFTPRWSLAPVANARRRAMRVDLTERTGSVLVLTGH